MLPGITEKALTAQLRDTDRDGIIERLLTGRVPPRVDYRLTDAGSDLIPLVDPTASWGAECLGVPFRPPR